MSLFDQRIRSVEEPKKCKKDSPILNNSIVFIAFHYFSGFAPTGEEIHLVLDFSSLKQMQ